MGSINQSFVLGIVVASLIWLGLFCLYHDVKPNWKRAKNLSAPTTALAVGENGVLAGEDVHVNKYAHESRARKQALKNYIRSMVPVKSVVMKSSEDQALSDLGMVKTPEDKLIKDEGYKLYAYNVLISNQLSYHRNIPDTRNKLCKSVTYPEELPSASVIICFYNEHFQTLLRTLHSIIDRTPTHLLEIILVDDYSNVIGLHDKLKLYIEQHFENTVKFFKTERREGLIRARLFGSKKAKGDVVVFLDSHIEVNVDWLPPLLSRIHENQTNVALPIIDIINSDTFSYTSSPLVRGGFNWGLHFKWENLPTGTLTKESDFIKPIKSPTMAGGLFAMDRKYFVELGEYDAGMNIWGGENLEISFRIWMCGGRIDLIPCSRVGHVFRHRRPYGSPDGQDTMLYNSLRVAHVWMDDYKDNFIKQHPGLKSLEYGNIDSRKQLRNDLKCKSFNWYLKHVYPELVLPSDDTSKMKKKLAALEQDNFQPWHLRKRNYVAQYQIRLSNTSLCVQSEKDTKTKGGGLVLKPCIRAKNQVWYETDKHELVLSQLLCLQSSKPNPFLYKCHEMGADQEWKHKGENNTPIYNLAAGLCLGVRSNSTNQVITMELCTTDTWLKTWDLVR